MLENEFIIRNINRFEPIALLTRAKSMFGKKIDEKAQNDGSVLYCAH